MGVKETQIISSSGLNLALLIECPKCFETYWFHTMDVCAKDLKIKWLEKKIRELK